MCASSAPAALNGLEDESLDVDALRAKYKFERDRRIHPDGAAQYQSATGTFGYYATDPYTERSERIPLSDSVEVLVIGGGFGGLMTGAKLRQAGVENLRMLDEAGDFGGTWYWNRYPGIRCDIESYVYMPLLEEVGGMPSERYATGEEIRQHAVAIAKRFDLYRDAIFSTRVTSLTWDEDTLEWIVETNRGDRMRARYVITSSGTLTQPKLPGIPGIDSFRGHTFHTSRWDYGYTGGDQFGNLHKLADKKVAVIGTGATGVQVVPMVARDAEQLLVFQRTPSSVDVRDNRPTDQEWAKSLEPGWQQERMENFLAVVSGEPVDHVLTRDGWTSVPQLHRKMISGAVDTSITPEERERIDELVDFAKMNEIRDRVDEVVPDPVTAGMLKPWYRYMCKRPTFSDYYLQAFNRPNVTLVDTADDGGITRMTETSIVVGGQEYEVDCVIFATGFDVGVSGVTSGAMPVTGRDGRTLLETWSRGPRTLHGFYTHGFPNLFHLGSLQNANSINFVHILLEQANHIAAVIAKARETGAAFIEPTAEAEEQWCRTIQEKALDNRQFQAECTPGYYNREGNPPPVSFSYGPGPVDFHRLLKQWRAKEITGVLAVREYTGSGR